ncbi:hypothetical protein HanXRQr2_Chr05g0197861 [Helianthus annuus]|uniref:Uncharacterized protein n=1 Tax=Helianthus annuus TaxID=4232 RepID=A0A9K3IXK7_HELAN|nr:hypothetical protein HanXRQr2_Chr05g0197861 [Helianthus annuus]
MRNSLCERRFRKRMIQRRMVSELLLLWLAFEDTREFGIWILRWVFVQNGP